MKLWSSIWSTKKTDPGSLPGEPAADLLKFVDLAGIGLGSSLGFAISVLIGHLLKSVTGPALVVSISLAGVTALVGGLCFAEFGVRLLKVDSAYGYCYLWGKETAAFIFGWILLLEYVAGTASGAKGVIAFVDSLTECRISDFLKSVASLNSEVFPYFDFLSFAVVAVIITLIVFGMKDSMAVKKIFTTCNIVLIIVVITAGTLRVEPGNWHPEGPPEEESEAGFIPFGIFGVAKGAAIAFYGFIGFDTVSITGNEVQKRKRNLPLAITTTIIFTLAAYAGVGVVLTLMLPYHNHDPHAAVPFAFEHEGWIVLKWIVAVASFFGFQTSLSGAVFPLPRIIYAMANDGLLFHCLGNSHSKLRIPVAASLTGGFVSAAAAGFISFEKLVHLAVMGALFVFTILAINVTLLRYSPKSEIGEENLSESWPQLLNTNSDISVKAVMKNYFNFSARDPTNLTKKIILANLTLFCLSSIGISLIFHVFHESLISCALETVIPAGIFLCVLCLNVISMSCQPKSRESAPFQVPLVPFLPCLSIFLNIFLMLTFEPLTWIFFSCWMAAGIVPYSAWRCLKCFKKEVGENSLYEINKSNAVKLSDSIWKIKSDKKSFYEGAVNPVFSDDLEDPTKMADTNKHSETTSLRRKQVDVIQKAELVEEEKGKASGTDLELNFFYAENSEIENNLPEEEKVHWECVAEIHTEDEFPQESVALEIVDNTYNFLSELSRDDVLEGSDGSKGRSEDSNQSNKSSPRGRKTPENYFPESEKVSEESAEFPAPEKSEYPVGNGHSLKTELLNKIKQRKENNKSNDELSNETENNKEISDQKSFADDSPAGTKTPDSNGFAKNGQNEGKVDEIFQPAHKVPLNDRLEAQEANPLPDEQNKVKEFKEKLNQLLKNQINGGAILTKNSTLSKANAGVNANFDEDSNDEKDNNALRNSVKTLNKSQIKSKLELLLTKGPPKRPSLGSSFNIKIKETDKEDQLQKPEDKFLNNQTLEMLNREDGGENFEKFTPDSSAKKETIFSLENKELPNDVCC